uniref:Uncharacterized protein n=1 Tax=Fundulus heteroclitus TaxID=8078 RepID=A0A3Q2NXF8_FUNHE
ISLTLVNPSILPVGLPCASCVWNTSLGRRLAGGGGSPAPFTADFPRLPAPACPPLTSSFATRCSFVALFFFFQGPYGMLAVAASSRPVHTRPGVFTLYPPLDAGDSGIAQIANTC